MANELDDLFREQIGPTAKKMPKSVTTPSRKEAHNTRKEALELIKRPTLPGSRLQSVSKACEFLEGAAGGRSGLVETLKFCPETSAGHRSARKLIEDAAINDVNTALFALCNSKKIRFESLVVAFKDALTAQLAVQALTKLAGHAPTIIDQIADDAKNRYDACPVCEGETRVKRIGDNGEWALDAHGEPLTQLCYNCRGTGKLFKEHDVQDRKLFLQITGILAEKQGTTINNVQQNAVLNKDFQPGDGSFERLIKAVDAAVGTKAASEEAEDVIDVPFSTFDNETHNPV